MDLKSFFKNKFQIVAMILLAFVITFACLMEVSSVFYYLTCGFAAVLCWVESAYFFVKFKNKKHDSQLDLLPLTPEQKMGIEKQNKYNRANILIKAIMLVLAGIVFVALMI